MSGFVLATKLCSLYCATFLLCKCKAKLMLLVFTPNTQQLFSSVQSIKIPSTSTTIFISNIDYFLQFFRWRVVAHRSHDHPKLFSTKMTITVLVKIVECLCKLWKRKRNHISSCARFTHNLQQWWIKSRVKKNVDIFENSVFFHVMVSKKHFGTKCFSSWVSCGFGGNFRATTRALAPLDSGTLTTVNVSNYIYKIGLSIRIFFSLFLCFLASLHSSLLHFLWAKIFFS